MVILGMGIAIAGGTKATHRPKTKRRTGSLKDGKTMTVADTAGGITPLALALDHAHPPHHPGMMTASPTSADILLRLLLPPLKANLATHAPIPHPQIPTPSKPSSAHFLHHQNPPYQHPILHL